MRAVADDAAAPSWPGDVAGQSPAESVEDRLKRLAQACHTGPAAAAELELYEWQREADCPAAAINLLAGLMSRADQHAQALALVEQHLDRALAGLREDEPALRCMLVALLLHDGSAKANDALARLHREHGHDADVMRWMQVICGPRMRQLPAVSHATIDQLAGELLDQMNVVPSLVAAQRIERDADTIHLLRGGLSRALRDVDDEREMLTACQALAELALMACDHDDARRWAHRGLRLDPYAATLAIILSRVEDDATLGPPATVVLKEAVSAHPQYPDLRAALIRRELSEGRVDVARRRLQQWLRREPNQRMAIQLQSEMAA